MKKKSTVAIPTSWEWSTIGEVVQQRVEQSGPRTPDSFVYVDISSIDTSSKMIVEPKIIPRAEAPSRARQNIQPHDVLVSMTRPNLNAVAIVPEGFHGAVGSTGFDVLRAQEIEPRWLFYLVQTSAFVESMSMLVQGALYPAIRPRDVRGYRIPIAPIQEQRRIVAEIEKEFTRLDAALAALKRVQANLKRYRAAVLKAACEGRLVPTEVEVAQHEGRPYESAPALLARVLRERRGRWEDDQRNRLGGAGRASKNVDWRSKYTEPAEPETPPLTGLPSGWCYASLSQISWDASYGTSEKCDYGWPGPPVLRIPNIVAGRIDLSDVKSAGKSTELDNTDSLAIGDMLIVRTNGSRDLIGRSAIIERQFERPHFFASYLIRFRLVIVDELLAWIKAIWDAPPNRARIETLAATTAGQYNVNIAKLSRLPVLLSPANEMRRITLEVERRLSVIDELEILVDANLRRSIGLRQAVLSKAFEGKLVAQESNDEPTVSLLQRISSDRKNEIGKRGEHLPRTKHRARPRKSVIEVLRGTRKDMSPEELFRATGFGVDAIDDFYVELKDQIESGVVEEHREGHNVTLRVKGK
jgi:type I restriction enzyme S subunit